MTEAKLRLTVIAVMAAVNLAVLFGWDITTEQIAGINTALLAFAAAILAWFSPSIPVGKTDG